MNKKLNMSITNERALAIRIVSNVTNAIYKLNKEYCLCELNSYISEERNRFIESIAEFIKSYYAIIDNISKISDFRNMVLSDSEIKSYLIILSDTIIEFLTNEFDNFLIMNMSSDGEDQKDFQVKFNNTIVEAVTIMLLLDEKETC